MARQVVADDVEVVWSGPCAGIVRPMRYGTLRRASQTVAVLFTLGGIAMSPLALGWVDVEGIDRGLAWIPALGAFAFAILLAAMVRLLPLEVLERQLPLASAVSQVGALVIITVGTIAAGPHLGVVAIYYVEAPLVTWMLFRTTWALFLTTFSLAGYALALAVVDAPAPAEQWLVVLTAASATSALVGDLGRRFEQAERNEHVARLELAELNRDLEDRVAEQVDELERVGQLRRFLAPQVADVVVSRGSEALLEPHRQDVAVLFCDLRGFTRFTNSVDADTVVSVLGEYYAAVGTVLEAHGATIGGYDGDGVMAYLGDPIPRADAPSAGLAMACAIGASLDLLTARWQAAGHQLGYGIGLAHGTATLGVVGFDGRFDYTALGAVVNLAARLCADAASGEIVVDDSIRHVAAPDGVRHRGDVELKGYDAPVPTFALVR